MEFIFFIILMLIVITIGGELLGLAFYMIVQVIQGLAVAIVLFGIPLMLYIMA